MWEKLISKHENVDMVVAGHMSTDDVICRVDVGEAGNEVYQLLMDPQTTDNRLGGMGLVALMYFTEDGNHARVEYYSTTFKRYFREANNNVKLHFAPEEDVEDSEAESILTESQGTAAPVDTQKTPAGTEDITSANEEVEATKPSADSSAVANKGGCSGTMSVAGIAFVTTLVSCAAFVAKKRED